MNRRDALAAAATGSSEKVAPNSNGSGPLSDLLDRRKGATQVAPSVQGQPASEPY